MKMGQIDSEKMYNIVMKWDWGNSENQLFTMIQKLEKTVFHIEQI